MALSMVNRRLLTECRRCGAISSAIKRSLTGNIRRTPLGGYVLTASALTAFCQAQKKVDLQEPDPGKLTQDYLLRSVSSQTADTVTAVLSQTCRTVIDAEEKYREMVKMLIHLTKYHLSVLGTGEEERIWDVILETRNRVEKCNQHRKELNMLFTCVEKLVDSSAEVAFLTGAEFTSTSLGERLHNAKRHVNASRAESARMEEQLREVQALSVRAIGEHSDKEEKLNKLQQDVNILVKEGKTKDLTDVGKTLIEKGKNLADVSKTLAEEEKARREMDEKRVMDLFEHQS